MNKRPVEERYFVVPEKLTEKFLMKVHYLRTLERMEIAAGNGNIPARMDHYDELSGMIAELNAVIADARRG